MKIFQNSLAVRLFLLVVFALISSHVLTAYLRSQTVEYRYATLMISRAAEQYALQIEALAADPSVTLPVRTRRPLSRSDHVWRAETNELAPPQTFWDVTEDARAQLSAIGAQPVEVVAYYIETPPRPAGTQARTPRSPSETLIAGRFTGVDGWVLANLRSGPPPPKLSAADIGIEIAVVALISGLGLFFIVREVKASLATLYEAAERVGPTSPDSQLVRKGPTDFHPVFDAFDRMRSRISELLTEKDVLLGALGHDLRTPLTSLRIRLESMSPPEERDQAIASVEHTSELLEDILELARSGNVEIPSTPYDLVSIVRDVVMDAQERGEPVTLDADGPVVALCRPQAIQRMVQNLIGNAVTYGGSAHVVVRQFAERAEITVEDDGPGLTEEEIDDVLSPFHRGAARRDSEDAGIGIGLTLVRAVAQSHGGDLTLRSDGNRGLRAKVSLLSKTAATRSD